MLTIEHAKLARLLSAGAQGTGPEGRPEPRRREPPRVDAAAVARAAEYLTAHDTVQRLESGFAGTQPRLWRRLLTLDFDYQMACTELRVRTGFRPTVRSLSGPHAEIDCLRAVREVTGALKQHAGEPWANALLHGPFAEAEPWIAATKLADFEPHLLSARAARAGAFGPVLEATGLKLLEGFPGSGPQAISQSEAAALSWGASVAIVRRTVNGVPAQGSAVFLSPTLLITAGHVVSSPVGGTSTAADLEIELPSLPDTCSVQEVFVHPGWANDRASSADYALLEVTRVPGVGVPVLWDFGASGGSFGVRCFGFVPERNAAQSTGSVERVGRTFYSSDLDVPTHVSGGGFFHLDAHGVVNLVGIATSHSTDPSAGSSFVGLPLVKAAIAAMGHAPIAAGPVGGPQ